MSGICLTYTFNISPELVNRIEEARQHHKAKYGDMGINSTFEIFFSHMLSLYIEDGEDMVEDSLVDLCVTCGFAYEGEELEDVDNGFNDF